MQRLDEAVSDGMTRWAIPGVSMALLRDGDIETRIYGVASVSTDAPARPDTLFQIGSISKVFTATLVMSYVDDGLLDLDTPVIEFIPDLHLADVEATSRITLRHLLTHTAGFFGDRFDDHGAGDDALAKAIAAFSDLPQQTRPGELWTYCNAGFDLAGRILEVKTGRRFEDLMRERIFDPLDLGTATYFAAEAIRHPVSVGHSGDPGGVTIADPWPIPRRSNPAGGIAATATHLARFAQMHINDGELGGRRVLRPSSAQAMRRNQVDADPVRTMGIGWWRREIDSESIVEHTGSTNGFAARLVVVPGRNLALAILTNHDRGDVVQDDVAKTALSLFCGLETPDPPRISLPARGLAAREGHYSYALADLILTATRYGYEVERVDRNPFAHTEERGKPFKLYPISDRIFAASGGGTDGMLIDFILNSSGGVRYLRFGGRLLSRVGPRGANQRAPTRADRH